MTPTRSCRHLGAHGDRRALSEETDEIVEDAVDRARERAVEQDGACHGKDLCPHAKDKPLGAAVDGRGDDRVGKAGDGNERSGARVLGDTVEYADTGQQHGQQNQRDRGERAGVLLRDGGNSGIQIQEQLSQRADRSAKEKGLEAVLSQRGARCVRLDQALIDLLAHICGGSPFVLIRLCG